MFTFINLQKIIDTLPPYEKAKLKVEGAESVNVCLEDIYNSLFEFEQREFVDNNARELASKSYDLIHRDDVDDSINEDCLDSLDNDTIVCYLEEQGYTVKDIWDN